MKKVLFDPLPKKILILYLSFCSFEILRQKASSSTDCIYGVHHAKRRRTNFTIHPRSPPPTPSPSFTCKLCRNSRRLRVSAALVTSLDWTQGIQSSMWISNRRMSPNIDGLWGDSAAQCDRSNLFSFNLFIFLKYLCK